MTVQPAVDYGTTMALADLARQRIQMDKRAAVKQAQDPMAAGGAAAGGAPMPGGMPGGMPGAPPMDPAAMGGAAGPAAMAAAQMMPPPMPGMPPQPGMGGMPQPGMPGAAGAAGAGGKVKPEQMFQQVSMQLYNMQQQITALMNALQVPIPPGALVLPPGIMPTADMAVPGGPLDPGTQDGQQPAAPQDPGISPTENPRPTVDGSYLGPQQGGQAKTAESLFPTVGQAVGREKNAGSSASALARVMRARRTN